MCVYLSVILSTYSISDGKKKNLTLYDPRFLTEHPSFTLRPAGTVTFVMGSVNSGSPAITETTKIYFYALLLEYFQYYVVRVIIEIGWGFHSECM